MRSKVEISCLKGVLVIVYFFLGKRKKGYYDNRVIKFIILVERESGCGCGVEEFIELE